MLQLSNRVEWFEVCFALSRLGAIPIMAQPTHRTSEIGHFIEQSEAVAWIGDDVIGGFDYREFANALRAKHTSLHVVVVVGESGPHLGLHDLMVEPEPKTALPECADASDVALLQLSGGSTGAPKLIPRTHDDYLYSVRCSAAVCGLTPETVYLAALPVAHNFPLSSPGALGVLSQGGTVVLCANPAPNVVLPWFEQEGINATAVVPPLARLWLDAAARRGVELRRLELLQVGGAKLDEVLARTLSGTLGRGLQQVFGMAEGLVSYTRLDDPEHVVVGTQGRPMSEADEVRLVDEQDVDVPTGSVGHLLTRGPYTVRGYYRAEHYNRQAFTTDGFYRTGDLVRQTAEGALVVEGRAKDQINRGGEKISAQELEEHLRATELVCDAALIAIPDAFLGERSCAVVVAHEAVSAPQLLDALRKRGIAGYKLPDRFEFTCALPRTPIGKIDKQALRERLAKGQL